MSGPMQWTPQGMVPVRSASNAGGVVGARIAVEPEDSDEDDIEVVGPVAPLPRVAQTTRKPAPKSKQATPKNIVRMARTRLREVKAELKRLAVLEKERAELERLIGAAENKPRAVVRELPKRSAG